MNTALLEDITKEHVLKNNNPSAPSTLTKKEEDKCSKYLKMRDKMKIPIDAIRNRMQQNGMEKTLIDKVCGPVAPSPAIKKNRKHRKKYKEGAGIAAIASSDDTSPYIWSLIIDHWKRHNNIDKNSEHINPIIINFICKFIYRFIKLPQIVIRNAFSLQRFRDAPAKPLLLKSAVYCNKKDFMEAMEQFMKNKNKPQREKESTEQDKYKIFVECLQNAYPPINFDTECLAILHLEIPGAPVVHYKESFQTGEIQDKCLWLKLIYSQWRKWAYYQSYVWCIVINKSCKFDDISAVGPGGIRLHIKY